MARARISFLLVLAAMAFVACDFQHTTSVTAPSTTTTAAPTTTVAGAYTSSGIVPGIPGSPSCDNVQWTIASQTSTSIGGQFSASCSGGITIAGTASGQLVGSTLPVTVNGSANLPGGVTCPFALSGTGQIGTDASITIPYSGTTCLGPVSGTQTLRRAQPAPPAPAPAPPAPTPPPPDPTPAPPPPPPPPPAPALEEWEKCAPLTGDKLALVQCVHDAINPVGVDGAFEVTKRVAWLLRDEGGGLMIKNGGDNIVSWRGYSFSAGRMMFSNFNYVKILTDVGGANGAEWAEQGPGDPSQYVPAMDPRLP
jgi:hypothetical protein